MEDRLPNIDAKTYTGTAVAAGYVLTEILSTSEQIAFASWLSLIADVLQTNAAWLALLKVQDNRNQTASDEASEEEGIDLSTIQNTLRQIQEDIAILKEAE